MWRYARQQLTDVSELHTASIFRFTIRERAVQLLLCLSSPPQSTRSLVARLLLLLSYFDDSSTMKMEASSSSETSNPGRDSKPAPPDCRAGTPAAVSWLHRQGASSLRVCFGAAGTTASPCGYCGSDASRSIEALHCGSSGLLTPAH
jgi:hypothetical protein